MHTPSPCARVRGVGVGTRPRYLLVCLWRRLLASRPCTFRPSVGPTVFGRVNGSCQLERGGWGAVGCGCSMRTVTLQGTRLQSNGSQNKRLFRDIATGAFRCDNGSALDQLRRGTRAHSYVGSKTGSLSDTTTRDSFTSLHCGPLPRWGPQPTAPGPSLCQGNERNPPPPPLWRDGQPGQSLLSGPHRPCNRSVPARPCLPTAAPTAGNRLCSRS